MWGFSRLGGGGGPRRIRRLGQAGLAARNYELVAVDVLENGHGAPDFGFWVDGEFDPFGLKLFGGGGDVVAPEGHGLEVADAAFVAVWREEDEEGVGAGDLEFDPTLLLVEELVGGYLEAEFFCIELERCVLIADRDADEFYSTNHLYLLAETVRNIAGL